MENQNLPDASARNRKLCRLVTVTLGLLCILQAVLNISLRLALYSSHGETPDIEARCNNLTEERDELKRKLSDFDRKQLDNDTRLKTVTEERDELRRWLTAFFTQQGWVYFNGSVYYISSVKKTWQESRNDCLQRGADLMIINSTQEQGFLMQLKDNMWIGLTDKENEGTWQWVDGTPLTTSYWQSNEPNSYESTEEDCAEVRYHDKENNWNDKPCDFLNFWICEKKVPL